MSKFIKKGVQCIGCRVTITEGALCKHCQAKEGTVSRFNMLRRRIKVHGQLEGVIGLLGAVAVFSYIDMLPFVHYV